MCPQMAPERVHDDPTATEAKETDAVHDSIMVTGRLARTLSHRTDPENGLKTVAEDSSND